MLHQLLRANGDAAQSCDRAGVGGACCISSSEQMVMRLNHVIEQEESEMVVVGKW